MHLNERGNYMEAVLRQRVNPYAFRPDFPELEILVAFSQNKDVQQWVSVISNQDSNAEIKNKYSRCLIKLVDSMSSLHFHKAPDVGKCKLFVAAFSSVTSKKNPDNDDDITYGSAKVFWQSEIEHYCNMGGSEKEFIDFINVAKTGFPKERTKSNNLIIKKIRKKYLELSKDVDIEHIFNLHKKILIVLESSPYAEYYAHRIYGLRKSLRQLSLYNRKISRNKNCV